MANPWIPQHIVLSSERLMSLATEPIQKGLNRLLVVYRAIIARNTESRRTLTPRVDELKKNAPEPSLQIEALQAIALSLEKVHQSLTESSTAARDDANAVMKELRLIVENENVEAKLLLSDSLNNGGILEADRSPFVDAVIAKSREFRSAADSVRLLMFVDKYRGHLKAISTLFYERLSPSEQAVFLKWMLARQSRILTLNKGELKSWDDAVRLVGELETVGTTTIGSRQHKIKTLQGIGYDLRIIAQHPRVIANDFYLNQYHHPDIHVQAGDVIIDAGAYTGDTALLFAHETGFDCTVHGFELSQENIDAYEKHLDLNPRCRGLVTMNRLALSSSSNQTVSFDDKGGGMNPTLKVGGTTGTQSAKTITLDDYVERSGIKQVDFIKMDIEGGEREAMKGALETIKRFKPRLAICVYHLWDDVFVLPEMILSANPDYQLGFKWVNKRSLSEAVLFAKTV